MNSATSTVCLDFAYNKTLTDFENYSVQSVSGRFQKVRCTSDKSLPTFVVLHFLLTRSDVFAEVALLAHHCPRSHIISSPTHRFCDNAEGITVHRAFRLIPKQIASIWLLHCSRSSTSLHTYTVVKGTLQRLIEGAQRSVSMVGSESGLKVMLC
jgi:hypothetical protein